MEPLLCWARGEDRKMGLWRGCVLGRGVGGMRSAADDKIAPLESPPMFDSSLSCQSRNRLWALPCSCREEQDKNRSIYFFKQMTQRKEVCKRKSFSFKEIHVSLHIRKRKQHDLLNVIYIYIFFLRFFPKMASEFKEIWRLSRAGSTQTEEKQGSVCECEIVRGYVLLLLEENFVWVVDRVKKSRKSSMRL